MVQLPKRYLVTLLMLFTFWSVLAQRHEFGAMGGITNYYGDLNHEMRFEPNLGFAQILYKNNQTRYFSFGVALSHGSFASDDANSQDAWQRNRNLSFHTVINEVASFMEFNFLPTDKSGKKDFISPYLKVGLGAFSSKVYNQSGADRVLLSAINTEGQTLKNGSSFDLDMFLMYGLGIKVGIGKHLGFGLEGGLRKTSTDYLDDVSTAYPDLDLIRRVYGEQADLTIEHIDPSLNPNTDLEGRQRGSNFKNDDYLFFGFFMTYTINNPKCPLVVE